MGYNTYVTGELTITPPLTWNEFKDSPFFAADDYAPERDLKLRIEESSVDTENGVLISRTAVALVMAWEDEYRAYNLMDHVQEAVDAFPGHTWSGRLECEGEENTDLWRVVIRDGRAFRIEPRIIWPDDEASKATAHAPEAEAK